MAADDPTTGFPVFVKDPAAVLDYAVELATWLGSDTLSTRVVTVPSGITKDSDAISGTKVLAWLSGGTAGVDYQVVYKWTTAGGRTDERTLIIRVQQR
jgi:hypothetical protein